MLDRLRVATPGKNVQGTRLLIAGVVALVAVLAMWLTFAALHAAGYTLFPTDLGVYMVTRGHGDRLGSTVIVDYNGIPRDIKPVVEVEFRNKEPNGKPVTARYTLKLRC